MAGAKPCLGYPSRTAAVLAMQAEGVRNAEIARRIGIRESTVSALSCKVRSPKRVERARARISAPDGLSLLTQLFPYHQLQVIRRHAAKRDMTAAQLIQAVVEAVVGDDIVDAVLDDGRSE